MIEEDGAMPTDPARRGPLGPLGPLRAVTEAEVDQFWQDGVVVLRAILPEEWIDALEPAVEATIRRGETVDMGPLADGPPPGSPADVPAFVAGVDHWRQDETLRAFALDSPLGAIAAQLLRSSRVRLWEDSVLIKEPGSPFETRFHTDASYFHVEGEQVCTIWVPLDAATPRSGMVRWVRGSHRDAVEYRPNLFVTDAPIPGTVGALVPDVMGDPDLAGRIVTFDVVPGDVTVHHARTLHGAPANSTTTRRRAVSVRYCGDDVRYRVKPGLPRRPELDHISDGDPLDERWCPLAGGWDVRP